MPFAYQDWALCIKISQITYFSPVFSGKKPLAHGESMKFWCTKPHLDRQNAWNCHITICKSNLGSHASIGHIHVFDSPCERVFVPETTQKTRVICDLLMREAKSWQAKGMIVQHHYMEIKPWFRGLNWVYLCFWFTMCKGLFHGKTQEK